MRPPEAVEPTVPVSYVLLILQLANEKGLSTDDILAQAHIPKEHLDRPEARFSLINGYAVICRYVMDRCKSPGLGYEFGLRSTITTHGILGYGLMSQSTLREVISFGSRYGTRLRMPAWDIQILEEGEHVVLRGTENVPHGPMRCFSSQQLIISCYAVLRDLFPQVCSDTRLHFDFQEPDYHQHYAARLPECIFSSQFNEIRIPASYLDLPLRTADKAAANFARQACEQELALFGDNDRDVMRQVRALLRLGPQGYPSLEQVAESLCVSARTLNRQLQARDSCFRHLLNEARRRDACILLRDPRLDLTDVAVRLGYSTLTNFNRAFREWEGCTPGTFRAAHRTRGPLTPPT